MALESEDCYIQEAYFRVGSLANGDYYPEITYIDDKGIAHTVSTRICMSGGNAPIEVKTAIAHLYRALEMNQLNHPFNGIK